MMRSRHRGVPGALYGALLFLFVGPASATAEPVEDAPASLQEDDAPPPAPRRGDVFRNRFSAGLYLQVATTTGDASLELLLSERLRWRAVERDGLRLDVLADGRLAIRLLDGGRVDRSRVRTLGVHLEAPRLTLDLGRAWVRWGGHRLVDGAQVLFEVRDGLQIGVWGGLAPDPWTTAPALRGGGGPIVAWMTRVSQVSFVGEVLGAKGGLDRLGGLVQARVEAGRVLEVRGRLDLQYAGPDRPIALADGALSVDVQPIEDLRLGVFYDAYSSLAYLRTEGDDPGVTRFAERAEALNLADGTVPQNRLDSTLHHLFGVSGRWRPALAGASTRLLVSAAGRYRHHATVSRRYARGTVRAGLLGLGGSRLDLFGEGSVLWWGGKVRAEVAVTAWLEPDRGRRLALDGSVRLGLERSADGRSTIPLLYADLFVDWDAPGGVLLSVGYRFTSDLDTDRWNAAHAALARVSWRLRLPRTPRSRESDRE